MINANYTHPTKLCVRIANGCSNRSFILHRKIGPHFRINIFWVARYFDERRKKKHTHNATIKLSLRCFRFYFPFRLWLFLFLCSASGIDDTKINLTFWIPKTQDRRHWMVSIRWIHLDPFRFGITSIKW